MTLTEITPCDKPKRKNQPPIIAGGVYMISPLATVSVWAALKLKLITWRDLCVWIALWEVRAWRDTKDPTQRNIFRFNATRVAQALGGKRAGSRLKKSLGDLNQLGLARLTPSDISFTNSLDDLPPELRTETERMLRSLGNENFARALRMPRRLMRHLMKRSRPRPLRVAVIFGMLLRTMMTKRDGWYKGCITTALLVDNSGFSPSRIKHERAALVREGFFRRLETPGRVRQLHGDWYELGQEFPTFSYLHNAADRQPPWLRNRADRQPPISKPAPSVGIERNQSLTSQAGASRSFAISKSAGEPSWHHMTISDLKDPQRRAALYDDACRSSAIDRSPAGKLLFYSAMARARRVGTINPCGMLRRIVETTSYNGFIAERDEEQARAWLSAKRSFDKIDACNLVNRVLQTPDFCEVSSQANDHISSLTLSDPPCLDQPEDSVVASYLTHRLQKAGFPIHDAFSLIKTTHIGKMKLAGWTQKRWNRALTKLSATGADATAKHGVAVVEQRIPEGKGEDRKEIIRLALGR